MMVPERDNMYGKGYKVFVVDDNGVFLSTLSKWLNEMNLSVKTFLSAEECLKHISEKPDIILTDFYLDTKNKKMNGDLLVKKVRQESPKTMVIVYSSKESIELAMRMIKLGAADFVVKDNNGLQKICKSVLAGINKIADKYENRLTNIQIAKFIMLNIFLIGSVFFISTIKPEYLPHFFIGALLLSIVISIVINVLNRNKTSKTS